MRPGPPGAALRDLESTRLVQSLPLAREFSIAHAFVDADELIHHPDVDLVIVLPPAPQHARYVRAAIAARKSIYWLHKFLDLVSEASATGTKQTVDFWPAV
jgi:hypothetical protein